jgi:hypothetical protein
MKTSMSQPICISRFWLPVQLVGQGSIGRMEA